MDSRLTACCFCSAARPSRATPAPGFSLRTAPYVSRVNYRRHALHTHCGHPCDHPEPAYPRAQPPGAIEGRRSG